MTEMKESNSEDFEKAEFSNAPTPPKEEFIQNFTPPNSRVKTRKKKDLSPGNLSNNVGVGKHAKTNIIWYIVSATFVIFSCIAASLVILIIYGYQITDITQSIKDVWGIFTPILTLALGYLFGEQAKDKAKDKKNKASKN